MSPETIDHSTLVRLVEAGTVRDVHAVGKDGGWAIQVQHGNRHPVVRAQRSGQPRIFRRLETLVTYLKDLGISRFEVDAEGFAASPGAARPDRAEALRSAHQAAAHDAWFRRQVNLAVEEAESDGAEWVSNEEARSSWTERRAALSRKPTGSRD